MVAYNDYITPCTDNIHNLIRLGAVIDQIAETDNSIGPNPINFPEAGFNRFEVCMYIGNNNVNQNSNKKNKNYK